MAINAFHVIIQNILTLSFWNVRHARKIKFTICKFQNVLIVLIKLLFLMVKSVLDVFKDLIMINKLQSVLNAKMERNIIRIKKYVNVGQINRCGLANSALDVFCQNIMILIITSVNFVLKVSILNEAFVSVFPKRILEKKLMTNDIYSICFDILEIQI